MRRVIKTYTLLEEEESEFRGMYGYFYKISNKVGVKLLCEQWCHSKEQLVASRGWKKATNELKLLKQAYKSGFTPKGIDVVAVRFSDLKGGWLWQPGIFMQYIPGKTQEADLPTCWELGRQLLKKTKLLHRDLRNTNVITERYPSGKVKKHWLIDFTPTFVWRRK